MSVIKPPVIAQWVLFLLSKPGNKFGVLGDIEEEYPFVYKEKGKIRANIWLMSQIIVPVISFLGSYILWSNIMFRNYVKVALRNLKKHKGHSFLNITGLAAGIACCIFILLYIQFHLSFDNYHEGVERTFLVSLETRSEAGTNVYGVNYSPIGEIIKNNYPEAEYVGRRTGWGRLVPVKYGEKMFYEQGVNYADEGFFEIFNIPFVKGNINDALVRPNTAVITEKLADKYFGDEDPLGKIMNIESTDIEITGVIENAPLNTHLNYEIYISWKNAESMGWTQGWGALITFTYIKLKPEVNPMQFEQKIARLAHEYDGERLEQRGLECINFLQAVKDIHLFPRIAGGRMSRALLNLYIFVIVGGFILIISCMNFMNLSTARFVYRTKEVGMRKVVGARRLQLIRQFIGESIINTAIAFILGLIISGATLWIFNDLAATGFVLTDLIKPKIVLSFLGLLLFVGLAAGSYPALFLSSFSPSGVLKGSMKTGTRGVFMRKFLVTIQFTICIVLMVGTLIVYKQVGFMKNQYLGFEKEQKLVVTLPGWRMITDNYEIVKEEFGRHSSVQSVNAASGVPGKGINNLYIFPSGKETERNQSPMSLRCDNDFIPDYGLELLAGRQFNPEISAEIRGEVFIINESLVNAFGWSSPQEAIGQELGNDNYPIIGVVKDFHWYGLQNDIEPLIMRFVPQLFKYITLSINIENLDETLAFVENTYTEMFPGQIFEYFFVDDNFDQQYKYEERIGKTFSIFSMLGIFIACLGLFGLASFTAEQRTKEIGIRKVLGSSISSIVMLISKDFIKWIMISMVIACPAGYWIMNYWLQNFAYRISPGILPFILAGAMALGITILSVSYQAVKAAIANPANALKYE